MLAEFGFQKLDEVGDVPRDGHVAGHGKFRAGEEGFELAPVKEFLRLLIWVAYYMNSTTAVSKNGIMIRQECHLRMMPLLQKLLDFFWVQPDEPEFESFPVIFAGVVKLPAIPVGTTVNAPLEQIAVVTTKLSHFSKRLKSRC